MARENFNVKRWSLSEIMHFGIPNHGTRCFRYSLATPSPSMVLLQGRNLATLEQPWSTIVRMESYPPDGGRSVIRSIDTYWKGPCSTCMSKGMREAHSRGRFVLDSWHHAHPLMYSSVNSRSLGPSYTSLTRFQVLAIPGCPPVGVSWISCKAFQRVLRSSSKKILAMSGGDG